ncbi:DUF3302 domain-containing protein [Labrenzia sp. CE80]|uniref:DUF3302 domain-containing protein n=1 Tax=Labrenzia sp. CE80 TaxID=1788986 RepID=UPI00129A9C41|nr:DUF3302 domain-containing protein [Labrenzia sp. CE80]
MGIIDFELDHYDYLTFAILFLTVVAFFYLMITLGGLPGKLAERRKHPHAESVKMGGWIGLFTFFPWIHALMWAYHDSLTIDVRKWLNRPDDPLAMSSAIATDMEPELTKATDKEISKEPSA